MYDLFDSHEFNLINLGNDISVNKVSVYGIIGYGTIRDNVDNVFPVNNAYERAGTENNAEQAALQSHA